MIQKLSPNLLAFLPMLYVAWADTVLTPSEIEAINQKIEQQNWLSNDEKNTLHNWLDPKYPPSDELLKNWMNTIRKAGEKLDKIEKKSLLDFGLEIADLSQEKEALKEIEEVLGIAPITAYSNLLNEKQIAEIADSETPEPDFDLKALKELLDGDGAEIKNKVRILLSDSSFDLSSKIDKDTYRKQILVACKALANQGLGALPFDEKYGGKNDMKAYTDLFEIMGFFDLSLAIKFGVQFGLFAGSIQQLGTKFHHDKYLKAVGTMEIPGCFAMTELGHGSNVNDLETTATYNIEKEIFTIHSPTDSARKFYIGNALHGEMATVFAQLIINEKKYGVHAFLVPYRNKNGKTLEGITVEDCGYKMGLNGVDNGQLEFKNVEIPRENLLNRFANVKADGTYESSIKSDSKRFFTMLSTLVGGRVCVPRAGLSAAKKALTIAIRHANNRRQFGPKNQAETLLIDYQSHQKRLIPLLANAYAFDFVLKYLTERYLNKTEEDAREVETLAAGLKAYATWNTTKTIQECREACGGQGYLSINKFDDLKADTEIFTTFEGDNTVLMQLVAKSLLTKYKQEFEEVNAFGVLRLLAEQAGISLDFDQFFKGNATEQNFLMSDDFQLNAFRFQERKLLVSVSKRLRKRMKRGMNAYDAFLRCQNHLLDLGKAYTRKITLEQFILKLKNLENESLKPILTKLKNIYALNVLEEEKGWFLESGYLNSDQTKAIRNLINKTHYEIKDQTLPLCEAFY